MNLSKCGKFTLDEDLSDIKDMRRIDLQGIDSLDGMSMNVFCVTENGLIALAVGL